MHGSALLCCRREREMVTSYPAKKFIILIEMVLYTYTGLTSMYHHHHLPSPGPLLPCMWSNNNKKMLLRRLSLALELVWPDLLFLLDWKRLAFLLLRRLSLSLELVWPDLLFLLDWKGLAFLSGWMKRGPTSLGKVQPLD